jgi:hypothetical protein
MVLRQALMDFFSKQIHNDGEVQSSDSDRPSSVEDMGESGQVEADLEALCAANGLNPDDDLYDIGDLSVSDFMQKVFNTWDNDPSDFPGSNHASAYLSGQDITYGRPYQNLTEDDQYHICELLTENYAKERMVGQFEIGKVVGDRFTITVQFSEAEGSFNRGIYLVEGMSNQGKGILKLLPTGAMNPGYAEREISILARLNRRNIIKLYHCHLPTYPHDTPWLIADYCNKLTLKDYVRANALSGHVIPELFAWQIFTSLVEAVAYCHNGDLSSSDWDEITHRDVIMGNIFIKTEEHKAGPDYELPFTIRLGDWGCGISQSEWINGIMDMDELPMVDPKYDPPEKAYPEEPTDVCQIGLIMWCTFCLRESPDQDPFNHVGLEVWPGQGVYSKDLHDSITACVKDDPTERPSVRNLLTDLHQKHAALIHNGLLAKMSSG